MNIALIDSGIGLLAAAAAVRRARPDARLVLSSDPGSMPWGPRSTGEIVQLALGCARAAARHRPDALVVACNTASVYALDVLRTELEPALPVIGTVPAVKPASAGGGPVAIWATPATTGSPYQRRLITEFGNGAQVTPVPCHGLADAIESADQDRIDAAVSAAAALTPPGVASVVLGCTHYELVAGRVSAALHRPGVPEPRLYGSAEAVAAQVLRRVAAVPEAETRAPGGLTVLLGGRPGSLPPAALSYPEGRLLTTLSTPV
ncbi:glutamate racemase [Streptomyces sp. AJS327]|uniref:glutamate racemase n=1 Tax=Streptomyces sp. AJS327 TaxID=2545265 RepID=UPI0015E05C86|nr:aspartate/glutamate racemase family protein [Streptomyces sp. AJS327]